MCVATTLFVTETTYLRPFILAQKPNKPALARIARIAEKLRHEVESLDEATLIRLEAQMPVWQSPHRGLSQPAFADYMWVLQTFPEMAGKAGTPLSSHRARPGRPLGARKDYAFLLFASRLITDVEYEAGGRLTLDGTGLSGSLLTALNLLAPFLPRGLIPNKPPFGTLKKILADQRRASERPFRGRQGKNR
jgi:hypothetical protein